MLPQLTPSATELAPHTSSAADRMRRSKVARASDVAKPIAEAAMEAECISWANAGELETLAAAAARVLIKRRIFHLPFPSPATAAPIRWKILHPTLPRQAAEREKVR